MQSISRDPPPLTPFPFTASYRLIFVIFSWFYSNFQFRKTVDLDYFELGMITEKIWIDFVWYIEWNGTYIDLGKINFWTNEIYQNIKWNVNCTFLMQFYYPYAHLRERKKKGKNRKRSRSENFQSCHKCKLWNRNFITQ